jgi:glyoxylase-like metal-dependent hydrolase (beta-lactamase superfamily II)
MHASRANSSENRNRNLLLVCAALSCILNASSIAFDEIKPEWCRALPRPEYKTLERVTVSDPWFEVYRVAPSTYAIYEPRQAEETISYLISGTTASLLFDTGMGIGDLKKVVGELTHLPVVVLNSHTHNDHVGDNWQFENVYGMDTDFTRQNARGSRDDALAELEAGQICGSLPPGFDAKSYATRPWKITRYVHGGELIDLGGRKLEIIATPGHTPDAISLFDRANGLLFTGDTYYPARIWLFRPETDLDAYDASIKRLSALAPQVKIVSGAHNIPVAESVLPRLVTAFEKVRSGKVAAIPDEPGKVTYKVDGISFLMRAPESR